ncbi:MAG: DUF167 domain-containing protein [Acidobacteriota bacterium]
MSKDGVRRPRTLTVTVRVHPHSRHAKVEELGPRELKVHALAPAEKGAANREVLSSLAAHFGVPVSQVRIIRGERSRLKLVAVELEADGPGKKE